MNIPEFELQDYNYRLPQERIAEYPLEDRSASKLLVLNRSQEKISNFIFRDISNILNKDHHLVFNETKVIAARIKLSKESGGKAELLLLKPVEPSNDPAVTISAKGECVWECLIGGKKINQGSILSTELNHLKLKAEILSKDGNKGNVRLFWVPSDLTFSEILDGIAKIPLPPYIKRDSIDKDKTTYQTVYANKDGSVAAPTAGLHFTDEVLSKLRSNGVDQTKVILHVGAGTFLPISAENVKEHDMHAERIEVSKEAIKEIIDSLEKDKKIICVGTTSIRTLESLCIFGEILEDHDTDHFFVDQWDPYKYKLLDPVTSLKNLILFIERTGSDQISGETKMIIVPGYKFRIVKGIITNFHQPDSTLLLLVGAFVGKYLLQKIYSHALENDYRFLSYGDSSLLL